MKSKREEEKKKAKGGREQKEEIKEKIRYAERGKKRQKVNKRD